ncbi:MAG: PhoU domain-containing protein [Dehalococcoidales bacterium]|nr:PhoU domain-containing protein [Dehalococcoidales bacterium]
MENRTAFLELLRDDKYEVQEMGNMVQKALGRSIEALVKRDLRLGHQVIADDKQINEKRFEGENKTI